MVYIFYKFISTNTFLQIFSQLQVIKPISELLQDAKPPLSEVVKLSQVDNLNTTTVTYCVCTYEYIKRISQLLNQSCKIKTLFHFIYFIFMIQMVN